LSDHLKKDLYSRQSHQDGLQKFSIITICIIVAVGYAVLVISPSLITGPLSLGLSGNDARLYAVLVPVFIAFIAILLIGAWIGWTMATTPPPKPIEEITTEIEEKNK